MNIICQSLYYQYINIFDKFHFLKSPKTFRVIITMILCCPRYMQKYVPRLEGIVNSPSGRALCLMPKYVPRLEGIMHSPSGRALCLLTLGHISAYNMNNTILLHNYCSMCIQEDIHNIHTPSAIVYMLW